MTNKGVTLMELIIGITLFLIALIPLTDLFSGTTHKIAFSINEINCSNVAMQILDHVEKSNEGDKLTTLVSGSDSLAPFPFESLPGWNLLVIPPKVKVFYTMSQSASGFTLLLEIQWIDKNEHKVRYGRFYPRKT